MGKTCCFNTCCSRSIFIFISIIIKFWWSCTRWISRSLKTSWKFCKTWRETTKNIGCQDGPRWTRSWCKSYCKWFFWSWLWCWCKLILFFHLLYYSIMIMLWNDNNHNTYLFLFIRLDHYLVLQKKLHVKLLMLMYMLLV